jgi:hypothetical protein
MDQATLAAWHDFYITIGAASASLVGLLFVALSLNPDAVTGPAHHNFRAFAEQAFTSFSAVLLIALFFLVPTNDPPTLGIQYLALAAIGGLRIIRRAPSMWRLRSRMPETLIWRLALPAAALVGLGLSAIGLMMGNPSALYWLVVVIIGLLMSAARSAWDLLVTVSEERRRAEP